MALLQTPSIKLQPAQIESWVVNNFPDNKPRKGGTELRINNPFNGDTGYNLHISLERAAVNDFRGNSWIGINPKTGQPNKCTFLKFVQLYMNCSWEEAVKAVLGTSFSFRSYRLQLGHQKLLEKQEAKKEVSLGLPTGAVELLTATDKVALGLKQWLITRGIDDRKLAKYRIMHIGFDVIWPYYEYDEFVYWQSRSRLNKTFRFPPESVGVGKGDFLYGFDQIEPSSYLILTEALIDAISVEEQCLASGGASLTDMQVRKIKALNPRDGLILAPDNDAAGIQSILDNYTKVKHLGYNVLYVIPPAMLMPKSNPSEEDSFSKDWNDLGKLIGFGEVKRYILKNTKQFNLAARKHLSDLAISLAADKRTGNRRIK